MTKQSIRLVLAVFIVAQWLCLPAFAQVLGDINGDGVVNAVDVQIAINSALGIENEHSHAADINGDGQVNAVDVQLVINAALGISIGSPVPDVVGLTQADAEAALTNAGLAVGDITEQHHPDFPEGHIISQNPAADVEVLPNTVVDLVVSLGVEESIFEPLPEEEAAQWIAPSINIAQVDANTAGSATPVTSAQAQHDDGILEYRVLAAMDAAESLRARIDARANDESLIGLYRYLGTVVLVNKLQGPDEATYLVLTACTLGGAYETALGSFTLPLEASGTNFGVHTIGPVSAAEIAEIKADMPSTIEHIDDVPILAFEVLPSSKKAIGVAYPDNVRLKTIGSHSKRLGGIWDRLRGSVTNLVPSSIPGVRYVRQATKTIQLTVSTSRFALDVYRNMGPASESLGELRGNLIETQSLQGEMALEELMGHHAILVDASGQQADVPGLAASLFSGVNTESDQGSGTVIEEFGSALWGDGTNLSSRLTGLVDDINVSAETYFYWIGSEEFGLYVRWGSSDASFGSSLVHSIIAALIGDPDALPGVDPATLDDGLNLGEGTSGYTLRCGVSVEGATISPYLRRYHGSHPAPKASVEDNLQWRIETSAGLTTPVSLTIEYIHSHDAAFSAKLAGPEAFSAFLPSLELQATFPAFGNAATVRIETMPTPKPYGLLAFEPTVPLGVGEVGLGAMLSITPSDEALEQLKMTEQEFQPFITGLLADAAESTVNSNPDLSFAGDGLTLHLPQDMLAGALSGILTRIDNVFADFADHTNVSLHLLAKGAIGKNVELGRAAVGLKGGISITMPLSGFVDLFSFAALNPNPLPYPIGFPSVVSNPNLMATEGASQRNGVEVAMSFVQDLVLAHHMVPGSDTAALLESISGEAEVAVYRGVYIGVGVVFGGVTGQAIVTTGYNYEQLLRWGQSGVCNRGWTSGNETICDLLSALDTGATPRYFLRGAVGAEFSLSTPFQLAKVGGGGKAQVFSLEMDLDGVTLQPEVQVDLVADTKIASSGEAVTFTASATAATGLSIVEYEWDFTGNGVVDQVTPGPTGASFDYAYAASGTYNAAVTAIASNGASSTAWWTVLVDPDDIVAPPGDRFVHVPAGTFEMGRTYSGTFAGDELPAHTVYLDAYSIGKFPITNAEYADVLNWAHARGYLSNSSGNDYTGGLIYAHGQPIADTTGNSNSSQIIYTNGTFTVRSREGHGGQQFPMDDHPMVRVSWYGAVAYCNWRSEREGRQPVYNTATWQRFSPLRNGYRLPTEAEWERVAAWDGSRHWRYGFTSDAISFARANYRDRFSQEPANPLGLTSTPNTSPVGWYNGVNPVRLGQSGLTQDSRSPVGAYDMSGNVWEWCHDWYASNQYSVNSLFDPASNPVGASTGANRVQRGGAMSAVDRSSRAANRNSRLPWEARFDVGFRVCISSSPGS